jgi:nitrate/TMAO reductase-like tetraheme cytochrome c subunit
MTESNIVQNYSMSIHGSGLYKDGLIVTATCSSCHTPHSVQHTSHPDSSVNRANITETCNQCHVGIVDQFIQSVHSPLVTQTDKKLPVCNDCHTSHKISNVTTKDFRLLIAEQCSNCHAYESDTYFQTYHGRAGLLRGGEKAAKCSDCHGSHNIMPIQSAKSSINKDNIVETCSPCHQKASLSFTTYLAHGTYSNKDKYPELYYTFWAMTGLLVGTFSIFGLHTILWVPRSLIERFKEIGKG